MTKFSIIIPIYGVESYLADCLESIRKQTYHDFEVIMVDDGTLDHSTEIMETYAKKDARFFAFHKENGGQSSARNFGVDASTGDYIIFVDGDDMIDTQLLEHCYEVIHQNLEIDIVRFQMEKVDMKTGEKRVLRHKTFNLVTGPIAFEHFITYDELFDSPCLYAFRKDFYLGHHFKFTEGKIHEDFGLIPYVIMKAKQVISISYKGYIYMERTGSVMTNENSEHLLRRMHDMFFHYDNLYTKVKQDAEIEESCKTIFYSFLANAILGIGTFVPKESLKEYKRELKKRHVANHLRADSVMRFMKKIWAKYFLTLYISIFIRKGR